MDKWQTVFRNETSESGKLIVRHIYIEEPESGEIICRIFGHPDVKVQEDRARLVASAPTLKQQRDDLLEACKAQKKANKWFGPSDTGWKLKEKARKLMEAAIAKCEV